ncbi:tRNA pseudouridine(55) synthase [Cryptococcus amylolentus CBS 6273]|uniref:tRNA pseudouridine(55) synthase n=1 Tax=Cryptococcus amylolentus CBS 6273 TaxID=1296118 RepID=A0A1E3JWZ6_9TREE|nr:tRNA pseudouridine(55) synthase [Cryptococcus amylolentus CBS 6273]
MPKASSAPTLPLNGLFPIAKPTGLSSMKAIDKITPLLLESKLFDDPEKKHQAQQNKNKRKKNLTQHGLKIGQGGTLDPLADGVLVIGVNRGTKHLNQFLECSKEYESIGLLGATTTSMDADDPVLATAAWEHVTREDVEKTLDRFRGEIMQVPPIFSALKMDGKPLYEYAREGKPLPRPIPARKCTVSIELVDFTPASVTPGDGGHDYRWPDKRLDAEEKENFRKLTAIVHDAQASAKGTEAEAKKEGDVEPLVPDLDAPEYPEVSPKSGLRPPTFTVRMTVSSGTYVRSIVNDIGLALGCGAHVQKLTRTRQGEFPLYGDESALVVPDVQTAEPMSEEEAMNFASSSEEAAASVSSGPSGGSIPWSVWERALAQREERIAREKAEKDAAIASGMGAEEIQQNFHPEEMKKARWAKGWEEWESEVLKRFKPVPVPISGGHNWRI